MDFRFKRGKKIKKEGGYTFYEVHYEDGKFHPNVHERIAEEKARFQQKINMLLHKELVKDKVLDWYAGVGSSEEAQLIWNTNKIPVKVIGRNFASADERVAEGTPFRTMMLEYKTNENATAVDSNIIVESGLVDFNTMAEIEKAAYKINDVARRFFAEYGVIFAEMEITFGKDLWKQVRMTSDFSANTCKLWSKRGEEIQQSIFAMDLSVEEVAVMYNKINEYKINE